MGRWGEELRGVNEGETGRHIMHERRIKVLKNSTLTSSKNKKNFTINSSPLYLESALLPVPSKVLSDIGSYLHSHTSFHNASVPKGSFHNSFSSFFTVFLGNIIHTCDFNQHLQCDDA